MNIKDFLIDNYIWIIVIILITIITIIGFLADRKKDNKEKVPQQPVPTPDLEQYSSTQMQYQPQEPTDSMQNQMNKEIQFPNQNMNIQNNQELANKPAINEETESINTVPTPTDINTMNNPKPIENIQPNFMQEPMYKPLSEQKPNIPPQPVPNYSNNIQEMNKVGNEMNQNNPNRMNMENNFQNTEQPMMPNQNYNIPNTMTNNNNNNFSSQMNNNNQPNTTIPTSVNQIRRPEPISPQPIMQNTYNNMNQTPNQNFNTGMPQGINSQPMNQQMGQQPMPNQTTTTPQPINFVFGPQNNNQNM